MISIREEKSIVFIFLNEISKTISNKTKPRLTSRVSPRTSGYAIKTSAHKIKKNLNSRDNDAISHMLGFSKMFHMMKIIKTYGLV